MTLDKILDEIEKGNMTPKRVFVEMKEITVNTLEDYALANCLEVERLKGELSAIADKIHYPDCWDTMAYPTLQDAIAEQQRPHTCAKEPS